MLQDENGNMFIKVGPNGATDHEEWDDGFGGYVTQIFIWHTDVIHGFQATYHRGGATVAGGMHGNNVGNFDAICIDGPLTSVSARWGKACLDADAALKGPTFNDDESIEAKVIKSLTFGTNKSTYGPFGEVEGEKFEYKATTGICGFHGRCYKGSGGRNSYHDIPGPDGWIGGGGPNGWIGAFGVYVNATPSINIGQTSVTLLQQPRPCLTDSVRVLGLAWK